MNADVAKEPVEGVPVGKFTCIDALPVPAGKHEFMVQFPDPGIVRHVAFELERRLVSMPGQSPFDEVLKLYVEFTPSATQRKHHFVVASSGKHFAVPVGYKLVHVGTAVSPNSERVAHVFEVVETKAKS